MITAIETVSTTVPTPKDLLAVGYSQTESDNLSRVFAELQAKGSCTTQRAAKLLKRKPTTALKYLNAGLDREHLAVEWGDDEAKRVWRLGPEFGSIPVTPRKPTTKPKRSPRTPLGEFIRTNAVRKRRCGAGYATVAAKCLKWRPSTCLEDIDANWLVEFKEYLKSLGMGSSAIGKYVSGVCEILRLKYPYRLLGVRRTLWKNVEPCVLKEKQGFLGHFYMRVYEPSECKTPERRKQLRCSVMRFIGMCGEPIKLVDVDNALLEKFRKNELDRGITHEVATARAADVRRIVNYWRPQGLRSYGARELPVAEDGTIQRFVADVCVPAIAKAKRVKKNSVRVRQGFLCEVVSQLHEYVGRKGLRFDEFTVEFCEQFLRWCISKGVTVQSVNERYRYILASISTHAVAAGLMKRRLYLEPVAALKRRTKPSTNGHPKPALKGSKPKPAATGKQPTGRKRGGQVKYDDEVFLWFLKLSEGELDCKPADLRDRARADLPGVVLPPSGRKWQALCNRARKNELPKRFEMLRT